MKMKLSWKVLVLAGVVLLAGAAVLADGGTWVSKSGNVHAIHGDAAFFGDGAEEFDLADLADGETRVLGLGAKAVTVSRQGDEATISRPAQDEVNEVDITCRLSSDTCKVLTFADAADKVVIVVEKTRECVNGVGDCDVSVSVSDLDTAGEHVIISRTVRCDDDGECSELEDANMVVELLGAHEGDGNVFVLEGDAVHGGDGDVLFLESHGDALHHAEGNVILSGPDGNVLHFGGPEKAVLRCSEGDTTMRVDLEEADDVFLCPKHSTPLDRVEMPKMIRRIEIKNGEGVHEH